MSERICGSSLDLISRSLKRYLDKVVPGIMSRLDWYFLMRYGEPFMQVLLQKPLVAYEELNDFFGGDKDLVEYFIYFVIKGLFGADRTYTDKAYKALLEQNEKEFLELLTRYYNVLR